MMTNTKNYLAKQIGNCIGKRRVAAGLTQDQVAERLNIGYEAISRIERGISIPTVIRLAELAEVFGCGIQELLVESSSRADDQAEYIKNMLSVLNNEDRQLVVDTIEMLYLRLKKSDIQLSPIIK